MVMIPHRCPVRSLYVNWQLTSDAASVISLNDGLRIMPMVIVRNENNRSKNKNRNKTKNKNQTKIKIKIKPKIKENNI